MRRRYRISGRLFPVVMTLVVLAGCKGGLDGSCVFPEFPTLPLENARDCGEVGSFFEDGFQNKLEAARECMGHARADSADAYYWSTLDGIEGGRGYSLIFFDAIEHVQTSVQTDETRKTATQVHRCELEASDEHDESDPAEESCTSFSFETTSCN